MNEVTLEFVLVPVPIIGRSGCEGCVAYTERASTRLCLILPACDGDPHTMPPGHTLVWKAKEEYE